MYRKDAQNLQEAPRCCPLVGVMTSLMSLLPSLAPHALKGEECRVGEGREAGEVERQQTQAQAALAFLVRMSGERGQAVYFPTFVLGPRKAWEGPKRENRSHTLHFPAASL